MFRSIFIASILAVSAFADSYIVLFQQNDISVAGLDHGGLQGHLEESNKKDVEQLGDWLDGRKLRSPVSDLWLIRGAVVQLPSSQAQDLKKQPWVSGVVKDQFRQFVSPQGTVKIGQTLSDVTDKPGELWGHQFIGLDKIQSEFPQIVGQGVRVGILDTGIQSNHPELAHLDVQFKDFINGLDHPYDDHGHGTHVAGTIAGTTVGIATKVSILSAKIFAAAGGGRDSEILAAMQWVYDPDGNRSTNDYAQIVNNSWGADIATEGPVDLAELAPFHRAVMTWVQGGMIPVFAAGNSGSRPNGFPGGFAEVIAVGAFDKTATIAEFSSRGPNLWKVGNSLLSVFKPDVSAPGVEIASAFPGNKYASWAGTSMATPHVTGALALLMQANPKLNVGAAKAALISSSEKKVDLDFGHGMLKGYELLKQASR